MDVQFEHFDLRRDRTLYFDGYVDAYRESYPEVDVPTVVRDSIVAAVEEMGQKDPRCIAMTAVVEGTPVGFIVVALSAFYVVAMAHIQIMYVDPAHRRRGIGRALLDKAAAWGRSNGARFMRLEVSDVNVPALSLYEQQGFVVTRHQMDVSLVA